MLIKYLPDTNVEPLCEIVDDDNNAQLEELYVGELVGTKPRETICSCALGE